ncbi:hypothetical protein GCM10017620_31340 [Brevundimonas intermedia]|uniref:Flagellar assembly protein FliH/Type III secretion system HrpE domain-containing protein n=1 Tax=Brevundimonas intermedia TaxID=74315 RepID=A0ABQ5TDM7_9CAUL|nr:hypothetical protein [Brevundimonas intermedia]GLK50160.1 hypothetical protein GCM10017620_31340 [Brevundimonas intermedia]
MTGVIKSGRTESRPVRALGAVLAAPATLSAASQDAERIAHLSADLAEAMARTRALAEEIDRLARAEQEAFARGVAEGRRLGAAEADARTEERLDQIDRIGHQAALALEEGLAGLETAAVDLAVVALSRLVDDADNRRALVAATVRRAIGALFDGASAVVEVSPEDFPDEGALSLLGRSGPAPVTIRPNAGLSSGDCRVRLDLGELDLGLDHQLHRLRRVLEVFCEGRA